MVEPELICIISSANGIYTAQVFAERYGKYLSILDHLVLSAGPDDEDYWDTWQVVLDTCKIGDHYLYQGEDGDIFLVPQGYYVDEEGRVVSDTGDPFLMELIEKINWN
jgi:hypothetical protein